MGKQRQELQPFYLPYTIRRNSGRIFLLSELRFAKKYRTTVDNIAAVNELENPDLIYPGQKLLIIKMKR